MNKVLKIGGMLLKHQSKKRLKAIRRKRNKAIGKAVLVMGGLAGIALVASKIKESKKDDFLLSEKSKELLKNGAIMMALVLGKTINQKKKES